MARILDGVPKEDAQSALRKVSQMFDLDKAAQHRVLVDERDRIDARIKEHDECSEELRRQIAACEELKEWRSIPVLERNDCSRLHKLKEAMATGRVIDGSKGYEIANVSSPVMALEHTFVVKHDWAGAFANADEIAEDWELPYSICAFEFRISGRSVILGVASNDANSKRVTGFIETGDYWYSPEPEPAIIKFAFGQVRAICVALDAEVAVHTVVRAPHKLNEKRDRAGKPKLLDFHVVDLARRHRVANLSGAMGGGGQKRLHWRRGHWRHFETSKTWVKWCLVGNPDLGFIQKHYTL